MDAWKGVMWFRYLVAAPSELLAEQAQLTAHTEIERILIEPPYPLTPISHSRWTNSSVGSVLLCWYL